jgi:RNA polymerase sigma-70 factor, ECF subfamily
VRESLAELPPQQSQLLMLRYAGLSYQELAQALDVAPTSIGTLLARAERAFEVRYRAAAGLEATGGDDAQE